MTIVFLHAKVSRFQVRFYTVRLAHAASRARRCLYSPLAHRYQAKLFNLTGLPELSEETTKVFWELRHLTAIKESVSIMGLDPEFASSLPAIERLERRIIKLLRLGRLDLPSENSLICKLFGNAALIHCKKYRANRSCDNHVIYQLKLRSLRDTLGVILGLYIYIRSG